MKCLELTILKMVHFRVCITKTVYHRSKMVLRKKRKCSNMKCLELTILKNGTLLPEER